MPLSRNTLMRIRTIDACLRRHQRLWTIEDLRQACEDALYEYEGICGISKRTIQRDIELMRSDKLGYNAPIVVKEKKYYTYEDPDFSITQLPLSKHDLAELSSAMDIIRHYHGFRGMTGQEDILARMQDRIQCQESNRQVIYIETNNQLKGLEFLGCLYDHILKQESIVVKYQSFKMRMDAIFPVSPYLLKEFNNRWFLIAYSHKFDDIQTLALDRIVSVSVDESRPYVKNTYFEPEKYLGEMVGVSREIDSPKSYVKILIDADQAPYVLTKPLHISQRLESRNDDGSIVVSLNVIHNLELERLLLGFGAHIEILDPPKLRHRLAKVLAKASSRYNPTE